VFGLRVRLLRTELVLGLGADAAMLISSASVGGGGKCHTFQPVMAI